MEVVPRKGDVDRNNEGELNRLDMLVVPRKGDVDRNRNCDFFYMQGQPSSPARGTWIEIEIGGSEPERQGVVPRKGDVDRN